MTDALLSTQKEVHVLLTIYDLNVIFGYIVMALCHTSP